MELFDVRLIDELKRFGIPLSKIKEMIVYIHTIKDKWLPDGKLIKKNFFILWNPAENDPYRYSISSGQAGEFSKTRNSLCVLTVNLTAIFRWV
jgi:hypothetical protein